MRKITVLVADDEASVRDFLSALIQRENLPVNRLLEAENGLEALELAARHQPDLIFMDIRMPMLDGLETAKRLKEENFAGRLIMLSAYSDFNYVRSALLSGAADYVLKPVKPADLRAFIRQTADAPPLRQPQTSAQDQASGLEQTSPHSRARSGEDTENPLPGQENSQPGLENQPPRLKTPQPRLVRQVLAFVDSNLSSQLLLEDIAKAVHMSPWHLSRTFKRLSGTSLAEYVRLRRLEEAQRLLLHSDLDVTEIAGQVGFDNASYFATCFKQYRGLSPSNFRKAGG